MNERDGYFWKTTKVRAKSFKKNISDIQIAYQKHPTLFNNCLPELMELINGILFNERKSEVKLSSPWLENKSKQIITLESQIRQDVSDMFKQLQMKWRDEYPFVFNKVSHIIAEIDLVFSSYNVNQLNSYRRPKIQFDSENSSVNASKLRHPITERICNDVLFVSNPVHIGGDENEIHSAVITGLNGVGKSIYIKSVALSILMAQSGFYVAADEYNLNLYHKLYTRIGNNDNLIKGQSTFYREMLELDTILRNADSKTLVIADELCSGSEQASAQAILASTIETLNNRKTSCLITTHFQDCLKLEELIQLKGFQIYHFSITNQEGNIIYNRKLELGLGPELYGVEVSTHIIDNKTFNNMCYAYRNKLLGKEKEDTVKSSNYNSRLMVEKCQICGKHSTYKGELHTHHINEQHLSDSNGVIGDIQKNTKGNLVVLCQQHHQDVHAGKISIYGWKHCLKKGLYLDYKSHENPLESAMISTKRRKYNSEQIKIIFALKHNCTKTKAKQILQENHGFKSISLNVIRRVWDETY